MHLNYYPLDDTSAINSLLQKRMRPRWVSWYGADLDLCMTVLILICTDPKKSAQVSRGEHLCLDIVRAIYEACNCSSHCLRWCVAVFVVVQDGIACNVDHIQKNLHLEGRNAFATHLADMKMNLATWVFIPTCIYEHYFQLLMMSDHALHCS